MWSKPSGTSWAHPTVPCGPDTGEGTTTTNQLAKSASALAIFFPVLLLYRLEYSDGKGCVSQHQASRARNQSHRQQQQQQQQRRTLHTWSPRPARTPLNVSVRRSNMCSVTTSTSQSPPLGCPTQTHVASLGVDSSPGRSSSTSPKEAPGGRAGQADRVQTNARKNSKRIRRSSPPGAGQL